MTSETILGISTISAGFGAGVTFVLIRVFTNMLTNKKVAVERQVDNELMFTRAEHDNQCRPKMEAILSRLASGDSLFKRTEEQLEKTHDKLDDLKTQILELVYKTNPPWDGKTERRRRE